MKDFIIEKINFLVQLMAVLMLAISCSSASGDAVGAIKRPTPPPLDTSVKKITLKFGNCSIEKVDDPAKDATKPADLSNALTRGDVVTLTCSENAHSLLNIEVEVDAQKGREIKWHVEGLNSRHLKFSDERDETKSLDGILQAGKNIISFKIIPSEFNKPVKAAQEIKITCKYADEPDAVANATKNTISFKVKSSNTSFGTIAKNMADRVKYLSKSKNKNKPKAKAINSILEEEEKLKKLKDDYNKIITDLRKKHRSDIKTLKDDFKRAQKNMIKEVSDKVSEYDRKIKKSDKHAMDLAKQMGVTRKLKTTNEDGTTNENAVEFKESTIKNLLKMIIKHSENHKILLDSKETYIEKSDQDMKTLIKKQKQKMLELFEKQHNRLEKENEKYKDAERLIKKNIKFLKDNIKFSEDKKNKKFIKKYKKNINALNTMLSQRKKPNT